MTEVKIRRSISFFLQGGKEMSVGSSFSTEAQPIFNMNPTDLGGQDGLNYYTELGISPSFYVIVPIGREVIELFITYKLPSLPEANLPTELDEYTSDAQRVTAKRDWVWKQPRKEIDVLSLEYLKSSSPVVDDDGNYLGDSFYANPTNKSSSFYGSISMRGIIPFYRQDVLAMIPSEWGMDKTPALSLRATNWGNLQGDDVVTVGGSYVEYIKIIPKQAIGVIA